MHGVPQMEGSAEGRGCVCMTDSFCCIVETDRQEY